jgi:hypothetical protein
MKRLTVIDHINEREFYLWFGGTMQCINNPERLLNAVKDELFKRGVNHFDIYFGNEWKTSSEL